MVVRRLALRAVLVSLVAVTRAAAGEGDELALMPLGDPTRALELVSGEAGQLLDLAGPPAEDGTRAVTVDEAVSRLAGVEVLLLGELHTSAACHDSQARLLEAIARSGRSFALGMEFFESEDDPALARFVDGRTDVDAMLVETGWYESGGLNFAMYRPLLEAARAAHAPVIGLNVPRAVIRTISRKGFEVLTDAERALVGEIGATDPRHRYAVDVMTGGFSATMPQMFDGMYRGQCSWDSAMARSILRARSGVAKDRLVVVVVGMGHVAHGLGIPQRLRAADPSLEVRVVAPVVAEKSSPDAQVHPGFEAKDTATFSRGFGDFALVIEDEGGAEPYPTFGITLEKPEGSKQLVVTDVQAGGVADRSGIRKDDRLVAIGGARVDALGAARLRLAAARWDERIDMTMRRGDAELVVPVLIVPATDGPGRWLDSEAASASLDDFDPATWRAPIDAPARAGLPRARLVRFREDAVRLDVFDGSRLAQSWRLDASGRPVLGLLAAPDAQGAIRVEIDRDATGAITSTRRFDAAGALVETPAVPIPSGAN